MRPAGITFAANGRPVAGSTICTGWPNASTRLRKVAGALERASASSADCVVVAWSSMCADSPGRRSGRCARPAICSGPPNVGHELDVVVDGLRRAAAGERILAARPSAELPTAAPSAAVVERPRAAAGCCRRRARCANGDAAPLFTLPLIRKPSAAPAASSVLSPGSAVAVLWR